MQRDRTDTGSTCAPRIDQLAVAIHSFRQNQATVILPFDEAGTGRPIVLFGRALDPLTDASLDPKEAVRRTLIQSIAMQTDKEHPLGCMMVLAGPISDSDDPVYQMVAERRDITRSRVLDRVRQATAENALPPWTDAEAIAGLVYGFLMGLSTQARDGVPAETMQRSADASLALSGKKAETVVAENRAE
ncbi:hypothetical protein ACFYWP_36500 [Actinacidiphila glaucinigra]|uniref:hypothetical protein n=1 Tax=Actinacidiphila glaucinigra TaxID=235986 RepID=UPI0036806BC9